MNASVYSHPNTRPASAANSRSGHPSGRLRAAEFVFPGHPDKLCDAIADALVEQAMRLEPRALVGVEVAMHRHRVFVTGRIGAQGAQALDIAALVREVFRSAGYTWDWSPAADEIEVLTDLCLGPLEDGEEEFRELADDQAICIGYANDLQATGQVPVEQWLVRRLARRLHALRGQHPDLALGPDGKVIVAVRELDGDAPSWTVESVSTSLQQRVGADEVALHRAVRQVVEEELKQAAQALPGFSAEPPRSLTVNGAGAFEVGGPQGDNGLSGKKLVVDAYGPRVPIGGGAWSGKDFFKADRAGALHARRLARFIVQLGLAREATVTLGWAPGDRQATVLDVVAEGGRVLDAARLGSVMDLSLKRSGEAFARTGGLVELARWGHFGEEASIRGWEQAAVV